MPTFERDIVVDAPREWLFDIMQDYERRLEWDEFLSEARLVGGATEAGPGVRALCVDRAGRAMETEYVSYRRPERVAVRMTRGPWMFKAFAGSWSYTAIDASRTWMAFRYHVEGRPHLLAWVADRTVAWVFAREMEKRLICAKKRLEAMWRAHRLQPEDVGS